MLHGRDAQLDALRAGLDAALVKRGGLVLISGEAGIGKSALATAIAAVAEARGASVTWGRAWEFADAPPYFPVWPCLRALDIPIGTSDATHESAFHLWERVLASLVRASSPMVWIIEDLHAADLGTLDLLTFLAQPLRATRVLVIATTRANDPRLTDRMLQRLARMARDGTEVKLEALGDRDVAAITEATVGREVSASALRRLVELTGGNPLFVVECARAFRAAGGIEGTLGALPSTVRQVVLDRVVLLPESTRHALAIGSVLGREFSAATVARMSDSLPARVIDTLLSALRAGIVRETKPGHFVFSHTLVGEAIADSIGAGERAAIHGRAVTALAALGDTAEVIVERARHAVAALPIGDAGEVVAIGNRATDLLEADGAFDRAFELHEHIDAARAAGFLPPASSDRRLHVARIARAAGQSDASRRICEDLIGHARRAGDAELFASAVLLHAVDVRPGVIDHTQVKFLEEARAMLGEHAPELGCRVLARLATAIQPTLDQSVPRALARDAVQRAHATGDDGAIRDVLELATWGLYTAPLAERVAMATELRDRALQASDLPKALSAYLSLSFHRIAAGDFDAFTRDSASMLALSEEIGHPRHRWRALLLASCAATTRGRFAESDGYVAEVAQLAALIDDPALPLSLITHDLMRFKLQRRDDEMRAAIGRLEVAMRGKWKAGLYQAALEATCAARVEEVDRVRAQLQVIRAERPGGLVEGDPVFYIAEAYAAAGTDDERRAARDLLTRMPAVELSGEHITFTYEGMVARLLGLLDASVGDHASAECQLRLAHTRAVERGHLPIVAQLAYDLSKVLRQLGRAEEARALVEDCARIAGELGMTGLVAVVNADASPVATDGTLLLEREGELWKVARGPTVVRIKDSRGVQLLARLIERPGEDIHVLALASDEGTSVPDSSAGTVLDDRARTSYRVRLSELDDALGAAEAAGDARSAARLEREKDALVAELARATGLGGRARQAGSVTERARINIQRRLKDAVARITDADADLGRYLERALRTGTFCSFRP